MLSKNYLEFLGILWYSWEIPILRILGTRRICFNVASIDCFIQPCRTLLPDFLLASGVFFSEWIDIFNLLISKNLERVYEENA